MDPFFTENLLKQDSELKDYCGCRININGTIKILSNAENKPRASTQFFGGVMHGGLMIFLGEGKGLWDNYLCLELFKTIYYLYLKVKK